VFDNVRVEAKQCVVSMENKSGFFYLFRFVF